MKIENQKLKNRENKAITLVVLVITVIILLILAGITINTLTNNGLFNMAKESKEKWENAQKQEETEIAKMSNEIQEYINGNRDMVMVEKEEYNKLLKSVNPFLWELNTEIDLGNGVYGYRIQKDSFQIPGAIELISSSANAGKIIDWGGSFIYRNGNMWALPASSYNMGNAEIYRQGVSSTSCYYLQFTDAGNYSSSYGSNLDVWVKYIK